MVSLSEFKKTRHVAGIEAVNALGRHLQKSLAKNVIVDGLFGRSSEV